jgi:hypothetical protein
MMNIRFKDMLYKRAIWSSKFKFYWLCGLILSFAYERPLAYVTPFDRTNPRLYDVMVFIGILFILPKGRFRFKMPKPFRIWAMLVGWFCVCAVIWAVGPLPWEYGKFSLFTAAKYLEGLIAIYMAYNVPINRHRKYILHAIMVIAGVFIAIYCIPEYIRDSNTIMIRPDYEVYVGHDVLVGPFGASYFQLAQTSALLFACALTFSFTMFRQKSNYWVSLIIAAFIAWPLIFSGSRTGLGLMIASVVAIFVLNKQLRKTLVILTIGCAIVYFTVDSRKTVSGIESSATIQRLQDSEGSENSIEERMGIILSFPYDSYKEKNLLPIIGAGFYVAPASFGGEGYMYRVDYGIHSIYLFPLEQSGIIGFVLFIWFIIASIRYLKMTWKSKEKLDSSFACSLLAYFVATLIIGIGGHNFWQGFSSGNINTCIIICLLIAMRPCEIVVRSKSFVHDVHQVPALAATRGI